MNGIDASIGNKTICLEAQNVAFSYTRNRAVLEQVSAEVTSGSFLAILGVNGCGKSTLLSCMDDLLRPNSGAVLLAGKDVSRIKREERAEKISLVAQHSHANRLTVYDAVLLGRKPRMNGAPTEEDLHIVDGVLEDLGLSAYALRYADELSGGEYQKVMLARAFAQQTDVLLLDEPTNNLDPANQQEVMRLVRREADVRGLAAAAVLHDVNLALRFCDRFLMLKDGRVAAVGGLEVVTEEMIELVYGMAVDIIEHAGCKIVVPR